MNKTSTNFIFKLLSNGKFLLEGSAVETYSSVKLLHGINTENSK